MTRDQGHDLLGEPERAGEGAGREEPDSVMGKWSWGCGLGIQVELRCRGSHTWAGDTAEASGFTSVRAGVSPQGSGARLRPCEDDSGREEPVRWEVGVSQEPTVAVAREGERSSV